MAAAADARYTQDLVPALVQAAVPTRLVWGRDDVFQKIEYARRYVQTVSGSDLVEVAGLHIPTEDSAADVARAVRSGAPANPPHVDPSVATTTPPTSNAPGRHVGVR